MYHSHTGFQEQTDLPGAIVIEPRNPDPIVTGESTSNSNFVFGLRVWY
jgi:FtsP/CotA-like multicopper oxidase with cupredoxin domain